MRWLPATITAAFVVAVLLTLYATGPSETASSKACPTASPTTAAAFCTTDINGHVRLARRTNAWERFKRAVTGRP
jgi:hypothetical protein